MRYIINQFPKNKIVAHCILSIDQAALRDNQKRFAPDNNIKCKRCGLNQSESEFYIKDKQTGRRSTICRDCQMKQQGVIELGKQRFAFEIAKKGFRRCSVCKDIKPLSNYTKNKGQYLEKSNNCYECSNRLHSEFMQSQKNNVGEFYVRQFIKRTDVDQSFANAKKIILENRSERQRLKYFIDGLSFSSVDSFARYVEEKYGINAHTVKYRKSHGYSDSDCIISESEARSKGRLLKK